MIAISGVTGGGSSADSRVETIARLAQWRIENFGPFPTRRSDAFGIGIWNWYLSVEKNRYLCIRLYPEPCRITKEQPTFPQGGKLISIWPNKEMMMHAANKASLNCLSRMLNDEVHSDVTIITAYGTVKAQKAVLSACFPVFESLFLHNLKEKESSLIDINDMTVESCSALLGYIYGSIIQEDFWKHRLSLLGAADKYDIAMLKECCEESLLEDINSGNVLERLEAAWLYQLSKLKKGCLLYLFDFGKIHDVRNEINDFFRRVDRELMLDMFHEMIMFWRPV